MWDSGTLRAARRAGDWREGSKGPVRVGSSAGCATCSGSGSGSKSSTGPSSSGGDTGLGEEGCGEEGFGVGSVTSSASSPAEMEVVGVGVGRDAFESEGELEGDEEEVGFDGVGSGSSATTGVAGRERGRAMEAGSTARGEAVTDGTGVALGTCGLRGAKWRDGE